jgi:1,4-dihydroxy-6-naphthoate synthase
MTLTLGFSPCPNDTFIFDALVNNKIDTEGLTFDVILDDVQTLNNRAIKQELDISKISYGVLALVVEHYLVLNAGGALGKGVGPLLITGKENVRDGKPEFNPQTMSVAIPGEHTTAHMLFNTAYPSARNKRFMLFSEIENAVLDRKTDAGVIIHENRFTYMNKGLVRIVDLGEYWEQLTRSPIPLGGIIMKRTFSPDLIKKVDRLIRSSVEYAFKHYPVISSYVKQHSQEMEEEVMKKHIDLYVNNYSLSLEDDGKAAVMKMLQVFKNDDGLHEGEKEIFLA